MAQDLEFYGVSFLQDLRISTLKDLNHLMYLLPNE
jgi:hypothetical protein